jgi:hypothetical protein
VLPLSLHFTTLLILPPTPKLFPHLMGVHVPPGSIAWNPLQAPSLRGKEGEEGGRVIILGWSLGSGENTGNESCC